MDVSVGVRDNSSLRQYNNGSINGFFEWFIYIALLHYAHNYSKIIPIDN